MWGVCAYVPCVGRERVRMCVSAGLLACRVRCMCVFDGGCV